MIVVTRLNGTRFAVNPDLIERIHESPDTHLVTLDGAAYVVLESLAEVVELIAEYRAYILSKARDFPAITGYPSAWSGLKTRTLILGLRVVVALGAVLGLMWFLQHRLGKGTGRRRADRALTIVSR
ncbi:flagellar FlbD family protein [Microbacterium sp. Bi128]|uniref:flagellar FlbD family protein n=1 Tax=Microbacterium sp. Bi128 TaxID=2821115 RepID=UPI001E448836|nr:flagellar FlbD family protein [Microbacterium sp. Bi128]